MRPADGRSARVAAVDSAHEIRSVTPAASDEEAAAIVAAIEQFMRQTAPAAVKAGPKLPAWQRAALHEGVNREADSPSEWGDPHPWTA